METKRSLFSDLWRYLPLAGLANEYHPCTEGGVVPLPFIQAQKHLIKEGSLDAEPHPVLEPPKRSLLGYMQGYSSLPLRDRALICLRSAYLCKARHLMPALAIMAMDHGLCSSDIGLIANGRFAPGWRRWDQVLISTEDDIYKKQAVSEKLWQILTKKYTEEQILDLVLCTAAFHLCISH